MCVCFDSYLYVRKLVEIRSYIELIATVAKSAEVESHASNLNNSAATSVDMILLEYSFVQHVRA